MMTYLNITFFVFNALKPFWFIVFRVRTLQKVLLSPSATIICSIFYKTTYNLPQGFSSVFKLDHWQSLNQHLILKVPTKFDFQAWQWITCREMFTGLIQDIKGSK